MEIVSNPFNITKAVDFSDEQILKMWVDWPASGSSGLLDLIKPNSPMPMFIVGGKGSGKTHLMRYYSYPLQILRTKCPESTKLETDKYIGVYIRCGGLNPSRFTGKGISNDKWEAIFAYYTELWMASYVLETIDDFLPRGFDSNIIGNVCREISDLFDCLPDFDLLTIRDIRNWISQLQKSLDYAVNNCVFTNTLDIEICATHGKLIFGIPDVVCRVCSSLADYIFVYLIDEYENFTLEQQRYINTLIRERRGHCSFKIGARLFGVRTHKTLSADEENKENSEFEQVNLDSCYRSSSSYTAFAKNIIAIRIANNSTFSECATVETALPNIESWFEQAHESELISEILKAIEKKKESPHLARMHQHLSKEYGGDLANQIVSAISFPTCPLFEKAACYKIYQNWSDSKGMHKYSLKLREEIVEILNTGKLTGEIAETVKHYKGDFLAQLQRDLGKRVQYAGLDTIIDLSWGNPRHLLMMLKNIYSWASFSGEVGSNSINFSIKSQDSGIKESSDWFFNDSKLLGENGDHIQHCLQRLCELFRGIRFSTKPSECSVCAFSADLAALSARSREVIQLASKCSLLVEVGTHTDKNKSRKLYSFQVNRLLSPRWDLPISRRGVIELNSDELDSIFDESYTSRFSIFASARFERMEPPFRSKISKQNVRNEKLITLPGVLDD